MIIYIQNKNDYIMLIVIQVMEEENNMAIKSKYRPAVTTNDNNQNLNNKNTKEIYNTVITTAIKYNS